MGKEEGTERWWEGKIDWQEGGGREKKSGEVERRRVGGRG